MGNMGLGVGVLTYTGQLNSPDPALADPRTTVINVTDDGERCLPAPRHTHPSTQSAHRPVRANSASAAAPRTQRA